MSFGPSPSIIMMPERLQAFNMISGNLSGGGGGSAGGPQYPPLHGANVPPIGVPPLVVPSDENNNGVFKMCGTTAGGSTPSITSSLQNLKKMENIHQQNEIGIHSYIVNLFDKLIFILFFVIPHTRDLSVNCLDLWDLR